MAGKGGYQAPARPASVSGPGALSARTDGGPGQAKQRLGAPAYGEQKDFQQIQGGAAMAATPDASAATAQQAKRPMRVTPLTEPSQRPDEPVTVGAALGPGGGPESIGTSTSFKTQNEFDARDIAQYMDTLQARANRPGVAPSYVRWVKSIREFKA